MGTHCNMNWYILKMNRYIFDIETPSPDILVVVQLDCSVMYGVEHPPGL